MFKVYETGFKMDLDNGYSVSIQYSPFNMCSNRQHENEYKKQLLNMKMGNFSECRNAETAVMDTITQEFIPIHRKIIDPDTNETIVIENEVQGYQTVKDFIRLINEVSDYPNTDSKTAEMKAKHEALKATIARS